VFEEDEVVVHCSLMRALVWRFGSALGYSFFVNEAKTPAKFETDPGLCAGCRHCRRVESSRGSVFVFCELSLTDPGFAKYPRLPVLSCLGYEKTVASE
jgi:hypothetical protein